MGSGRVLRKRSPGLDACIDPNCACVTHAGHAPLPRRVKDVEEGRCVECETGKRDGTSEVDDAGDPVSFSHLKDARQVRRIKRFHEYPFPDLLCYEPRSPRRLGACQNAGFTEIKQRLCGVSAHEAHSSGYKLHDVVLPSACCAGSRLPNAGASTV